MSFMTSVAEGTKERQCLLVGRDGALWIAETGIGGAEIPQHETLVVTIAQFSKNVQ